VSPDPELRTSAFDYPLPHELIAYHPAEKRDESRLLVLDRATGGIRHLRFHDLASLFADGDVLVLNETRVIPARLLGAKPTGAQAEVLLIRPSPGSLDPTLWEALVKPGSKLKPGTLVRIADDMDVEIVRGIEHGGREVRIVSPLPVSEAIAKHGRIPLPPYIEREPTEADAERYQTVYAAVPGSVAAPTAGLHFTPALLAKLESAGVEPVRLVLHVGPGTFRPVETDDPAGHDMHAEDWRIPETAARALEAARARGGRIWAVGTTVVRTLESAAREDGRVRAGHGSTRLFIRPGYRFRVVDRLITNFHLPRSTLLMLVSAFGGHAAVMAAYAEAIRERYRFYSYGDAMAIL
jgi:S-adenosylmethionine:tRNA ribosyltransferase-isomerase